MLFVSQLPITSHLPILLPSPFVIAGPTASGKSALAVALALAQGQTHVVNADPFQAWHGMDVLTAQPTTEERAAVPHHLYGVLAPDTDRDAVGFAGLVQHSLVSLAKQSQQALVVSGSGLYLRSLFRGLDPGIPPADATLRAQLEALSLSELLEKLHHLDPEEYTLIDRNNPRRVVRAVEICLLTGKTVSSLRQSRNQPQQDTSAQKSEPVQPQGIWLDWDSDALKKRIKSRAAAMLSPQLRDELAKLDSICLSSTARQTLGLDIARAWRDGKLSATEAETALAIRTWQYAKRQRTWFRKTTDLLPLAVSESDTVDTLTESIFAIFGT